MSDIQKQERDKRQKRREARRERVVGMHSGQNPRENDHEENPPTSGHDQQEEGVEQKVSPTEEEVWIEQPEALQLRAPKDGITLSPTNPYTRIENIVEEDLRLRVGDFSIWSRLGDDMYTGRQLIICRPKEGNWVTFQAAPSHRSIHLLLPTHEGAPPPPHTNLEETKHLELWPNSCSGPSTVEVDIKQLQVDEELTTDGNASSVD